MTRFLVIFLKGFAGIPGKVRFKLNRPGLNNIHANNGTGKTTIFSGLCWVLFGITLKKKNKVNTWPKFQPKGYQGTMGRLLFRKDKNTYEVIRCSEYKGKVMGYKGKNRLILIENGKERTDLRDKADVQREIIDILGFSFDLFTNSVVFGQKLKRIIDESGPQKKKVFDEAFEVSFINKAKKVAEAEKDRLDGVLTKAKSHHAMRLKLSTVYEEGYEELKIRKKVFEKEKKKKLNNLRFEIGELVSKIEDYKVTGEKVAKVKIETQTIELHKLEDQLSQIREMENALFKAELELENHKGTEEGIDKKIRILTTSYTHVKKVCNACQQPIPLKLRIKQKQEIKSEIAQLKSDRVDAINAVTDSMTKVRVFKGYIARKEQVTSDLSTCKQKLKALEVALNKQENAQKLIEVHTDQLNKLLKQKRDLKKSEFAEDILTAYNLLKDSKVKLTKTQTRVEGAEKEMELQNWLIKVPLSNAGIKSYIFHQMLGLVNERLEIYSENIGFGITFGIKLDTHNKDFYASVEKRGEEVPYDDLSGGEQQLVNIAIAFSIHDVISIEKPCNVLILDECFEHLDKDNIEIVSEMIMTKAKDRSVFLITHLESFIASNSTTIGFKKTSKGNLIETAA
jgi:DNA repair exonuclease SbcCD ATPase subunit